MTFDYDFIGVGGLAYDLALRVERLPLAEDKYPAELMGKLPGGFIANATCAAARLGLRTGYIGWVGDDDEATMLHKDFLSWGVDPAGLLRVKDETTPFTLVMTDQRGKRSIVLPSFPLYDAELTYEQSQLAARARVVYSFPRDPVWCAQLRHVTVESGGLLALDIESAVTVRGDELIDIIRMADIVFLTESTLKMLGLPPIRKLIRSQQWIIMTAGSKGAYGIEPGRRRPVFEQALRVPVLDTTGAGDCFHAALIAARLDGAGLREALVFAHAAAALAVQHAGARGGLPTRKEVEAQLRLVHP